MTGYHVTDTRNRAGILCEGLLARDTIRHNFAHLTYEDYFLRHNRGIEAVYVHHSPYGAGRWAIQFPPRGSTQLDVWEVSDVHTLPIEDDPEWQDASRIRTDVPPDRLRLLVTGGPDDVAEELGYSPEGWDYS